MVLPYRSSGGIGWPDNLLPRFPPTHPVVPAAFPGAASGRSNDGRNRGAPASGGLGDSSESNEEDVYEAKASQQFGTKFSSRSWARMRRSKPPHAGRSQGKREMSSSLGLFSSLQIGLRARIARSRRVEIPPWITRFDLIGFEPRLIAMISHNRSARRWLPIPLEGR